MGTHTSSADVRRVLDSIRRIVQLLRLGAADAQRQLGLSAAQLFVLDKLGDGSVVSINQLAARTHTHQSSVSVVIQRLLERKLVRRCRSSADARRNEVTITAAGLRKLSSAPQAAQDRLIEALTTMAAKDRKNLARLLEAFVRHAGAGDEAPGLFFEDQAKKGLHRVKH